MTEEANPFQPKRKGWPLGKPRKPQEAQEAVAPQKSSMISKMKARPNWDDDTYVDVSNEGVDRLRIPREIVDRFARDGIALQWITHSVRGQQMPQEVAKYTKGGWTQVYQSDFDGVFDGMFMPKGADEVITVDDCMLVARPMAIHLKAKERERREAQYPLDIKKQEIGAGLNIPGGDHPSATTRNHINVTREGIEVPQD